MTNTLAAIDSTSERLRTRLVGACGPVLCDALRDPSVTEIEVNPDGKIWLQTFDDHFFTGHFMSINDRRSVIAIVADAMEASAEDGALEADFPNIEGDITQVRDRFQAVMPPYADAELISIRRHSTRVIPLHEYVEKGIIPADAADLMRSGVRERKNFIIAGGTGSGKTTFGNALLNEPGFASDRVIMIEDRRELRCTAPNSARLMAVKGKQTIRQHVQTALRLNPDRIIIGEVRDGAALDALKAWNTGHPGGLLTVHADGAIEALERLEDLIKEVSADPQKRMIGRAVDYVVFLAGKGATRRVREIIRVLKHDGSEYVTEQVL